jgi:hypothetical protein
LTAISQWSAPATPPVNDNQNNSTPEGCASHKPPKHNRELWQSILSWHGGWLGSRGVRPKNVTVRHSFKSPNHFLLAKGAALVEDEYRGLYCIVLFNISLLLLAIFGSETVAAVLFENCLP